MSVYQQFLYFCCPTVVRKRSAGRLKVTQGLSNRNVIEFRSRRYWFLTCTFNNRKHGWNRLKRFTKVHYIRSGKLVRLDWNRRPEDRPPERVNVPVALSVETVQAIGRLRIWACVWDGRLSGLQAISCQFIRHGGSVVLVFVVSWSHGWHCGWSLSSSELVEEQQSIRQRPSGWLFRLIWQACQVLCKMA